MKNRVLIMAALLLGSLHLLAQNKVTGTVTDKMVIPFRAQR